MDCSSVSLSVPEPPARGRKRDGQHDVRSSPLAASESATRLLHAARVVSERGTVMKALASGRDFREHDLARYSALPAVDAMR